MRAQTALATVAAVALLGACGARTADDRAAEASAPSTPPSAEGSASGTPSQQPSETTTPTTSPVRLGDPVTIKGVRFRMPAKWADVTDRVETGALFTGAASGADELPDMLAVSEAAAVPTSTDEAATAAKAALGDTGKKKIRRLDDVTIGGADASHVRAFGGDAAAPTVLERFDVVDGDRAWVVTFQVNRYLQPARRDAMVAAVLDSVRWR